MPLYEFEATRRYREVSHVSETAYFTVEAGDLETAKLAAKRLLEGDRLDSSTWEEDDRKVIDGTFLDSEVEATGAVLTQDDLDEFDDEPFQASEILEA